ncbi:hypothetical protein KUTeg_008137 [Tegillarca granosa]|uniref:USP domain-containing protein n=1 Tax=Tegillarca granosa TaxID=220873 RepID=A0ABQ9FAE6_TEGGR|nr:hypothetical protein KUTeg_008137 [Tegillarca granosa]
MNRILFSAIEDSLIGTSGRGLINRLYHGTIVNQIVCLVCGKVSEREENFLDLTLSITGLDTLENGLKSCYIEKEIMDGKNQYRCERCNKLVDATKGARIRCLPEILTISLLRFSYDFVKGERYKETGKFVYPMTLNMAPYYEHAGPNDINEYELFSVVIHRGGAYGGHYHAYIKDIDGLGKWTHPDEETIQIPTDPTTGEVDFIECDCPVELIQAILHRHKDIQTVDKLCGEITKQTGVSWNKRFKKQFGPIHKFLAKYDDKFIYDPSSNHISLKDYGKSDSRGGKETSTLTPENSQEISTLVSEKQATQANVNENSPQKDGNKIGPQKDGPSRKRPPSPSPEIGQCWFDFNDSRVYPIRTKEIEWQYSGKESAYMLFYRKKSLLRPEEAMGNPAYKMPDRIISEVLEENDELHDKRMHYEIAVNLVTLQLHFGGSYQYYKGALWPLPGKCIWIDLNVDRRNTIQDLKLHAMEVGSDLICEDFVIHRMKELPAGSHLYDCVSYDDEKMLKDLSIDEGTKLFIWNGTKYDEDRNVVSFRNEDFQKTLEELKIKDGDKIILDSSATSQKTQIDKSLLEKSKMKSKIEVHIENKCMESCDKDRSRCKIEVEINQTVGELKVMAISKFGLGDIDDGGRLRIEHDRLGLRPPLHDGSTIETAAITQGTNLILERGPAPNSNQITLTFTPGDPRSDLPDKEIIVDRNITVGVCLQCMINKAGYNGLLGSETKETKSELEYPVQLGEVEVSLLSKPVQQQKGKKKCGQKTSLRQAPYNIQDGDVIGVMKDDFGTIEDDLGQEEMKRQIEEIRKQREERRKMEAEFDGFQKKSRRPEVALKIKVDDFR